MFLLGPLGRVWNRKRWSRWFWDLHRQKLLHRLGLHATLRKVFRFKKGAAESIAGFVTGGTGGGSISGGVNGVIGDGKVVMQCSICSRGQHLAGIKMGQSYLASDAHCCLYKTNLGRREFVGPCLVPTARFGDESQTGGAADSMQEINLFSGSSISLQVFMRGWVWVQS